jgi:hypothetical protein
MYNRLPGPSKKKFGVGTIVPAAHTGWVQVQRQPTLHNSALNIIPAIEINP